MPDLPPILRDIPHWWNDFSHSKLYKYSISEIWQAFECTDITFNTLNFSHNNLNKCSADKLAYIFSGIPSNITTLILSHNDLQKKIEAEWIKILNRLPERINIVSDPLIPILRKIQERASSHISNYIKPSLTNIVMEYAVRTSYFKYPETNTRYSFWSKLTGCIKRDSNMRLERSDIILH